MAEDAVVGTHLKPEDAVPLGHTEILSGGTDPPDT
jgi:hypothetical protein